MAMDNVFKLKDSQDLHVWKKKEDYSKLKKKKYHTLREYYDTFVLFCVNKNIDPGF